MGNCILAGSGGAKFKLLGTNTQPTSSFTAKTVQIDLSGYDLALVVFKDSTTGSNYMLSLNIVGLKTLVITSAYDLSGRWGTATTTGINFTEGHYRKNYNGSAVDNYHNETNDNTKAIPYQIYGIKL